MNPDEQLFTLWAPDHARWSVWAKPPAFIGVHRLPARPPSARPTVRAPAVPDRRTAVIVELPGPDAVRIGLELAGQGFRPVPLFNACRQTDAFIDLGPLASELRDGAPVLVRHQLPDDAPPVFLLDAGRLGQGSPRPGQYDNRSVVLPQDFPSAARLKEHGVHTGLLYQVNDAPAKDLAPVLLRWQEAGIQLLLERPSDTGGPVPLRVRRPSFFRSLFHEWFVTRGYRRSSAGGFGAVVPIPQEHTGSGPRSHGGYRGGFG